MTDVIAVSAAAVILALIISAVKKTEPGIGGVLSVFLTVWLIAVAASLALYFKNGLAGIGEGRIGEYLPYVLKSVGIGFLSQTAADICTDANERSAASGILTAGKLGILTVCLPLIKRILETAIGYING
ncbi:MAG: hypothetical protein IKH51_06945 [Clostridia bacterium]|nr:hypothetical protein [Clostridia bacterium]